MPGESLRIDISLYDADGNLTTVGADEEVYALYPGADISSLESLNVLNLDVEVDHAGGLFEGQQTQILKQDGTLGLLRVIDTIVYNPSNQKTTVTFQLTVEAIDVTPGDRIIGYYQDTNNHVKIYKRDVTETEYDQPAEASDAGTVRFFTNESDLDLVVYNTNSAEVTKMIPRISVKSRAEEVCVTGFRADITGSTDTVQAVQNAVDFVHANLDSTTSTGVVTCPPGTKLLFGDTPLEMRDRVTLRGAGSGNCSILQGLGLGATHNAINATGAVGDRLEDVGIEGFSITHGFTTYSAGVGINAKYVDRLRIKDVIFKDPYDVANIFQCDNPVIEDVYVLSLADDWNRGFYFWDAVGGHLRNVQVRLGRSQSTLPSFIFDTGCLDTNLLGCTSGYAETVIQTGRGGGFLFRDTLSADGDTLRAAPPHATTLVSCVAAEGEIGDEGAWQDSAIKILAATQTEFIGCIARQGYFGLEIDGANVRGVTWTGGAIYGNAQSGVFFNESEKVNISGATISNNGQVDAPGELWYGVNAGGNATDFRISDCQIGSLNGYGTALDHAANIRIELGADKFIVADNTLFKGSGAFNFQDLSTTSDKLISNNSPESWT